MQVSTHSEGNFFSAAAVPDQSAASPATNITSPARCNLLAMVVSSFLISQLDCGGFWIKVVRPMAELTYRDTGGSADLDVAIDTVTNVGSRPWCS